MFCFLSMVPKGKTIRNPGREGGGGGGGKFPVHEIFFSRSWLPEFFSHVEGVLLGWCTACTNFFLEKFPLQEFFWGELSHPPPGISNGPPLKEQNSFDTTSFLWLELTR